MPHYPPVWLLRHGQTEWNAERRIQGQMESPLTALGVEQSQRQALLMPGILAQNPACFVSPLGRAQQTAQIALGATSFVTDARLAEAHAGEWQGLKRAEVKDRWPELYHASPTVLDLFTAAPNGEEFEAFRSRIANFLSDLTGPSVVVAHGLLGQVLRGLVCGLTRSEMGCLSNEQGCVYVLEGGREQVLR
jgi:2,3-bisphosphoglycerate-dependent phosphoglycerate mutase